MKKWLGLVGLVFALFVWVAGCGGDDLFDDNTIGGDAAADARGSDATTTDGSTADGSTSDGSTSDGSVSDSGANDAGDATVDSGEDSGIDAGVDSGTDSGADSGVDAGAPFDVTAAAATTPTTVTVTFDAPPDATQANVAGNYAITDGTNPLAVSAASLSGSTVTLTTAPQAGVSYTVTVSNVVRSGDLHALDTNSAMFTGIPAFNVVSAASTSNTSVDVTFSDAPTLAQAEDITNYAIAGLNISAASLTGNVVTLTTDSQGNTSYMVTVSNVTRSSDSAALSTSSATFLGSPTFNVLMATSTASNTVDVTFDAVPDMTQAETAASYVITDGVNPLNVTSASLSGSVVTLTTDAQSGVAYTLTVNGVTRATDHEALSVTTATFGGPGSFNVSAAQATSSTTVQVTFDQAPNQAQAEAIGSYSITPALNVTAASLSGNVVTLTTDPQTATTYTVRVSGVTRDSDSQPLVIKQANFTGRTPFKILSAASTGAFSVDITFDADANPIEAAIPANYNIAPTLNVTAASYNASNHTVTLTTALQSSASTYTVTIANVTRASDGEVLFTNSVMFGGSDVAIPTVDSVTVQSTAPDNGTTPYNTGTTTVVITGKDFTTVDCTAGAGVKLDDLDGIGGAVGTHATVSCTVDSDTQITAAFPAGIRTNGSTGWNVLVTNSAGTNATSAVKLVPVAGLVISEVLTGTSAGGATHEFLEIYNPTGLAIDTQAIGMKFHTRGGTGSDAGNHPLTLVSGKSLTIASHGFMLVAPAGLSGDSWNGAVDGTYASSGLVSNGSAYLSFSTTKDLKVIDKVGWGTQPAGGFEGTATADIPNDKSIQRIIVSSVAQDTDSNVSDFNAPSTSISPTGTTP